MIHLRTIRALCPGYGEDIFSIYQHEESAVAPIGKPFVMSACNPERCVGWFTTPDAAQAFLAINLGYEILEVVK